MEDPHPDDWHLSRKKNEEEDFSNGSESPRKGFQRKHSLRNVYGQLPGPGNFFKLAEVLSILRNAGKGLESLPPGKKNNVFFVIDDSINVMRREKNFRTVYFDDCGPWDRSKYKTNTYYIDPMGKDKTLLRLRDGLLCKHEYRTNEGSRFRILNPQPDPNTLIKLNRYYTTQQGNMEFKRRITSVSGWKYNNVALIEYCGVQKLSRKNETKSKNLVDPMLIEKVSEKLKYKPIKQVYEEMLNDTKYGTITLKQVESIKYLAAKKRRNEMLSKVTDEKRAILTMLAVDPSVQAVINRKDKPPCVILYSDDQFSDMKRNLECETVLGIDCCHKFGDCFVTMTVYQNSRALHKDTNEPLLYLGPVFIHWDQEFLTYVHFFSHIMGKLDDIELNIEVKLGSESNLSLFKALKYSFPTSEYMLNSDHLKETIAGELLVVLGGKKKECSMIVEKIFGLDGIIDSNTLSAFKNKTLSLVSCFNQYLEFKSYFDRQQILLYQYVWEPQQRGVSQQLWFNDSDKVLDDYLKVIIKENPQKLPELMEKICDMIRHLMLMLENV